MSVSETNGQPVICLFGSYSPKEGDPGWELAYSIGRSLAAAGYTVANGGYDGIMEASAKGAKDAGGKTVGVTCSVFAPYRAKGLTANPYIDKEIHHTNVVDRIMEMLRMSAGYVILPGGTGTLSEFGLVWEHSGTLSEFGLVWEHVSKGLIGPRPIFVVGDFWRPMVQRMIADRPRSGKNVYLVDTAHQIVEIALRTVGRPAMTS